ncbi:MAG: type II secretion system protein M [Burkholderiales bacterium]|nr:type II secretion system protein M [Burkholderiales bacterium]
MKLYFYQLIEKYKPQLDKLAQYLAPVKDYWKRQTQRDQQILLIVAALIGAMLVLFIISSAIDFKNDLKTEYTLMAQQRMDAQIIAKQYKELSQITPNDFNSVNSEKIKGDAKQVLGEGNTEVIFADNILTVKKQNVKFDAVVQFLDQLRKSYGLFPDKLNITRSSQVGYVAFSVSFNNVEQQ